MGERHQVELPVALERVEQGDRKIPGNAEDLPDAAAVELVEQV
jgi:hypothetical protein